MFESSSDTKVVAFVVASGALEMPPPGSTFEMCEKKRQAEMDANSSEIRKVKRRMDDFDRDLGHEVQFTGGVEGRMTKLEDKDREKTNKMEKIEKRLEALKTNYALVSSDQDRIMPPKMMKRKAVKKMVKKRIAKAIEEYEKTRANPGNASGSGAANTGGIDEGVVRLKSWFEKMEQVFEISKCAEDDKVKFDVCTFEGRALTWWNRNV
ncbi:hypothetical protein Tco_0469750 [Tanacetum coccineum]